MYDQCNDCAPSEILEKSEKYLKAESQILSKKSFSIFQKLGIKLYKMINQYLISIKFLIKITEKIILFHSTPRK